MWVDRRSFWTIDRLATVSFVAQDPHDPLVADAALRDVVARVPRLGQATQLHAAVLTDGPSSTTYVVTADGTRYAVRITGDATEGLGIDRWQEGTAILRAADAGIAPQPVEFLLPEGHLVTRYLNDARPLTLDEFTSEAAVPRVARRLKDIHRLDAIEGTFDPYDDIRRWLAVLAEGDGHRPTGLDDVVEQVAATEQIRAGAFEPALCHNDPSYSNFLDDGNLWVVDWRYAGMGDPLYDLGGAAYPLSAAGRDLVLESYFGRVDPDVRSDLDRMIGVYLCWNTLRSLIRADRDASDSDVHAVADDLIAMVPAID